MQQLTHATRLSALEIFKIGVGPSSSHTLGPWRAAQDFVARLINAGDSVCDAITVDLYGSLAKTGVGHGTDIAVQLGLAGHDPVTVDTDAIVVYIEQIARNQALDINRQSYKFNPQRDILFHAECLPYHPNALVFKAWNKESVALQYTYYSVGGGFIEQEDESQQQDANVRLPYPIDTGADILAHCQASGLTFAELVAHNEAVYRSETDNQLYIKQVFNTMLECVYKGCTISGELPGGLKVKRRAADLCAHLLGAQPHSFEQWYAILQANTTTEFVAINQWISCFALAVNEQNAAFGRVVTSPTNGAAGVIPAVLLYHYFFDVAETDVAQFLLVAGEVGCLFKKGATISAAVGGCQAEIGVSSAMAAAGLTSLRGGTPAQILTAAEIAMEHHLGLTCDPIKGLVQVPCIERNTMGAMKAITASHLAMMTNPENALINIDTVIQTMWQTAQDMSSKYKETAEGGLAINLAVNIAEC